VHNIRLLNRRGGAGAGKAGERGAALVEFAVSAPFFALLIYGISQIALLSLWKYQLLMVTHAVMREAAGGTTDARVLTALANGYARAGGLGRSARLAVLIEPVGCATVSGSAGISGSLAAKFSPGVRLRVRALVPLSGLLGRVWRDGFPMESSAVVLPDPWKGCLGWLKGLLGVDSK